MGKYKKEKFKKLKKVVRPNLSDHLSEEKQVEMATGDNEASVESVVKAKGRDEENALPGTSVGVAVSISAEKSFRSLGLSKATQTAINKMGFTQMTEIQAKTIPHLLEGRDLVGAAKTGSGKTLAFLIPVVELVCHKLRMLPRNGTGAIVISPTRELAMQTFGVLREILEEHPTQTCDLIIGGANREAEAQKLQKGVSILVATPVELLDHLTNTPGCLMNNLQCLIIDEADRILQMGFEEQMKKISSMLPERLQRIAFCTIASKLTEKIKQKLFIEAPLEVVVEAEEDALYQYVMNLNQSLRDSNKEAEEDFLDGLSGGRQNEEETTLSDLDTFERSFLEKYATHGLDRDEYRKFCDHKRRIEGRYKNAERISGLNAKVLMDRSAPRPSQDQLKLYLETIGYTVSNDFVQRLGASLGVANNEG